MELRRPLNGALAGAAAAAAWAAQQPLDKKVFGSRYDDVEILGKLVTRGPAWPAGAMFGAVYALARPLVPGPPVVAGIGAAMAENFGFWPLGVLIDRHHPARGELESLHGNRRAFGQATWRHLLFGIVLAELERRTATATSSTRPWEPASRSFNTTAAVACPCAGLPRAGLRLRLGLRG